MSYILTRTLVILVVLCHVTGCFDPLALDENKILRKTRAAFANTAFEKEPFLQKEKIQAFASFLLRHIDDLKGYNRHEAYRTIQLAEGRRTGHYVNSGDCFGMPTFHESFIRDYIPPELIDSLYYYSEGLRDKFVAAVSICNNHYRENVDTSKGSISFVLSYKKEAKDLGNYCLYHTITQNRKFVPRDTINTIYGNGLAKDTLLHNNLRYRITVYPYTGL